MLPFLNRTGYIIVATSTSALLACFFAIRQYRLNQDCPQAKGYGSPTTVAIQRRLSNTQPPVSVLGICVDDYADNQISLSAPLRPHNANVHGTAFAGSLYSVAVLASYTLGEQWLLDKGLLPSASWTLVARSGSIRYRRAVTSDRFVATSQLPNNDEQLHAIEQTVQTAPFKAVFGVDGIIRDDGGEMCASYSIELCLYDPVAKRKHDEQQQE